MSDDHYDAEVNKGSVNMRALSDSLNDRWRDGWRLAHVFDNQGNTVLIWERRGG